MPASATRRQTNLTMNYLPAARPHACTTSSGQERFSSGQARPHACTNASGQARPPFGGLNQYMYLNKYLITYLNIYIFTIRPWVICHSSFL